MEVLYLSINAISVVLVLMMAFLLIRSLMAR